MRKLFAAMTIAAFAMVGFVTLGYAADKGGPTVMDMLTDDTPADIKWTGFYVGAHAGLSVGDNGAKASGVPGLDGVEADATLVGIHGGLDYRLPGTRLVARGMVDYTYSGMTGGMRASLGPITVTGEYELAHQLSASAGLGYLVTNRAMLYGFGGYTYGYTDSMTITVGGVGNIAKLSMPDLHGWHVGAGAELRLSDHWSMSAQYRLTEFENTTIANIIKLDTRDHSARLGVAYRF